MIYVNPRSIWFDEIGQIVGLTFKFFDFLFRCRRNIYDKPFGGLVVYLAGDFLQAQGDYQKKEFHKTYANAIFQDPSFRENYTLVYFPPELDKRHEGDEKFGKVINDLRIGDLKEEHIQFLKDIGKNLENLNEIREAVQIVNKKLCINYNRHIHSCNDSEKGIVSDRLMSQNKIYQEKYNDQWIWPLNSCKGVSFICTESRQNAEYDKCYAKSLESSSTKKKNFIAKTTLVWRTGNGDDFSEKEILNKRDHLSLIACTGYDEALTQLQCTEIIIVEGNTYGIRFNSKEGFRHELVKVTRVGDHEVFQFF